ncbi:alpha/beta hydrolase [Saccharopolyspora mangrovi]|uniref:Alpha/beta hydrolase n=1 Tax=Saccharopolyspora mangrovi TaxID=3082379 RepID=A0ABU6AHA2_9PSEU|nr:alpha/beta hydrolase [Saccharopolyspora sp. S2-29]MEB3370895.1 alpha/beta hydrolase [Saccharopolyspora sp. S2-29]
MRLGWLGVAAGAVGLWGMLAQPRATGGQPYVVMRDLGYAPRVGNAGRMDLYLPAEAAGACPVVMWTAGSAWLADNGNSGGERVARALCARGYAVAAVAVRSSQQARFPGQVHDGKAAVRWLRANAARYGLDGERIAVMGTSSGGWLASMLGATAGVVGMEGDLGPTSVSSEVQAVVDLYGPTDFLAMDSHMPAGAIEGFNRITGGTRGHDDPASPESRLIGAEIQTVPGRVAEADPSQWVRCGCPPWLILHGTSDPLVPYHQSELLLAALHRAGVAATLYEMSGRVHEHDYLDETRDFTPHQVHHAAGGALTGQAPATWSLIADFLDTTLH